MQHNNQESGGDTEPLVRPDGQKPRVKSNILAQLSQGNIDPIQINKSSGDDEPVVRPDGQKPRVKSNILANNLKPFKKSLTAFRHSKKVESAIFEPTTLSPLENSDFKPENSR